MGNFFEIGVFQGKSAFFLASLANPPLESLGICDLDERHCRLTRWRIEQSFPKLTITPIITGSSIDIISLDVPKQYRFWHIDGSHEYDVVSHDLQLASDSLHDDGCIVVDDVFNEDYPGVIDGLYGFFRDYPRSLVPVVIGFGKIVLTRPQSRDAYIAWFRSGKWRFHLPGRGFHTRETHLLSHEVFIFRPDIKRKLRWRFLAGYLY